MTPRDALRALVDASPPDAVLSVPARWLSALLSDAMPPSRPAEALSLDLTVNDLAERMNRKPSTVRTWCERGELPGAYRNRGREWRIPPSAVEAMQREQAKQQRAPRSRPTARRGVTDLGAWRQHVPAKGEGAA